MISRISQFSRAKGIMALVIAGLLVSSLPADAGLLGRSIAIGGVGYALKKNLEDATGAFADMTRAVMSGDRGEFLKAQDRIENLPKNLTANTFPGLNVANSIKTAARTRLASIKSRIQRFVIGAGKTAVDVRLALAVGKKERDRFESKAGILDSNPLPSASSKNFVNAPVKQSDTSSKKTDSWSLQKWAEEERRTRPDCYGIVDDKTAAECDQMETSDWGSWSKNIKSSSSVNAEQARGNASDWASGDWKAETSSDWQPKTEYQVAVQDTAADSRREYDKALADTLGGSSSILNENVDYGTALEDLEAKELARQEAERRRIEAEQRRKEEEAARKAEERRQRELERQEQERQRDIERRYAEMERENERQAWENITQSLYNFTSSVNQQLQDQIQEQQEQQRRQAARQAEADRLAEEQYQREIQRQEEARIAAVNRQKAMEEEAARRAEQERRRIEAEREAARKAEIERQKALRKSQCQARLSQNMTRCVQVKGSNNPKYHWAYYLRNTCNVKIAVWYDYKRPLSSLTTIRPGQTKPTSEIFGHQGKIRKIIYGACIDNPGVSLSKNSNTCIVHDWACTE